MKHIRVYLGLTFIFACAMSLAIWTATLPVNAMAPPPQALFCSPLPPGDNKPSPPEATGEVIPGVDGEDEPLGDPETPGFSFVFPPGAASVPVQVRVYNTGLPAGVPSLPNSVGSPFFLGIWSEGTTIRQFNPSISINTSYDDTDLTSSQEERLRIYMYSPAIQAWVKLGGKVDAFNNVVTGLLSLPTPFEDGNTLFVLGVDETPLLKQVIGRYGKTTLSLSGDSNFRLHVLPGTVEVGTHFEVTTLANISDTNLFELLADPIDIKACYINHNDYTGDHQITDFPKLLSVEFDYGPDVLARAGGKTNLTIVSLQNGQWVDVEELGYSVIRQEGKIIVDTDDLGIFGLAVKKRD